MVLAANEMNPSTSAGPPKMGRRNTAAKSNSFMPIMYFVVGATKDALESHGASLSIRAGLSKKENPRLRELAFSVIGGSIGNSRG